MPASQSTYPDYFDRLVNYGDLAYDMYFGPAPTRAALPATPPPAPTGTGQCACPSCASPGHYATAPVCAYWRADCEACDGHREHPARQHPTQRVPCETCARAWTEDIAVFRLALRSPRLAARCLRLTAVTDALLS